MFLMMVVLVAFRVFVIAIWVLLHGSGPFVAILVHLGFEFINLLVSNHALKVLYDFVIEFLFALIFP